MAAKKRSSVDRLIKGIIIGGAIGSVVGVTLAPKSGKETRADIRSKATSLLPKQKKLPSGEKPRRKGVVRTLFGGVRALFFGKKKS